MRKLLSRAALMLALGLVSGCGILAPFHGEKPTVPAAPPAEEAVEVEIVLPEVEAEDKGPSERRIVAAGQPTQQVLILSSSDADNYADVAAALEHDLAERYRLHVVDLSVVADRELALIRAIPAWSGVVAIGASAAEFAQEQLRLPTVFCQIFDYEDLLARNDQFFAVEALPPIEVQLRSWTEIAPHAKSVGLIASEGDHALVASAEAAAEKLGIEVRTAFAKTDREAVYQFKRIAQLVDGILLHPSRSILSPGVIREILDYSSKHGVHSIVFDDALLDWGAMLSVGSDPADIAGTVAHVLDQVVSGNMSALDRVTPLSRADVRLNEAALGPLGPVTVSANWD